ncbi:response regulator transcription factor [Desulfosarcina sp. OttesenSCG-928-A07]|nr:response regulator transcription factor [Desulfosarcina sp. OttesenSCG-928-A07]
MRILLVEDEASLLRVMSKRLGYEGYGVDTVGDGEEALAYIEAGSYDCIVMDIMLPKKDGLAVLRQIREKGNPTPVLLLTARDSIHDRVTGLDAGADDYLVKPFAHDELSARIRALLRRHTENKSAVLGIADLTLDPVAHQVHRAGTLISLSAKEFSMLEYFLRNPDRVLTRGQIIDHIWNFDFDNDSNIVDVYVRYLRRKIDQGFSIKLLHTVRGVGYVLRIEA